MEYFILTILAAACLQSAIKLTLLPRLLRYALPLLAALPVFFLQKRIAALNLQDITAYLNDGNNLIDLCTLVVVQELLALVIGVSLVKEIELEEKKHYWKYVALLPSVLMPVAALYLLSMAFNHLTRYSFNTLTWAVAGGFAVAMIGLTELIALARRTRLKRTASALNAGWLLLMLAVFLPVVATSRISGIEVGGIAVRDLGVIGVIVLLVGFMTFVTYYFKIFMEKRRQKRYEYAE